MRQALLSISANALRSCMLFYCPDMSFIGIHSICQKCTPAQIMSYQAAIHLYKVINESFEFCTTEHALLLNNIVCPRRQLKFEIFRNNITKIGLNSLSNKFHHISKLISLDVLNLGFVHFKKLAKIQFLKNANTWNLIKVKNGLLIVSVNVNRPNGGHIIAFLCLITLMYRAGWSYNYWTCTRWQVV